MPLQLPPAVNYPTPLVYVPAEKFNQDPPEGPKIMACEIDWATMGGTSHCVNFNLQNNTTLNFSQICSLAIDNSACGSDLQFIFPDTNVVLTIPAYSPFDVVPVFTNQTQFFVVALAESPADVTKFSILNFVPPPIAIPATAAQQAANNGGIPIVTIGNTQIVPLGVNGTIQSVYATFPASAGVGGTASWQLVDGGTPTPKVIASGTITSSSSATPTSAYTIINIQGADIRFQNGLQFQVTASTMAAGAQQVSISVYYRTP